MDVFDAMKEEFLLHGWRKNNSGTNNGPKCLMGCLSYVQFGCMNGSYSSISYEMNLLAKAIRSRYITIGHRLEDLDAIVIFNDDEANDINDIFALLDKAREIEQNEYAN